MTSTQHHDGWQLTESSAEAYERYLVTGFMAPAAEQLLEAIAPEPGEALLDVACGTGVVARQAAPRVGLAGTVVGVDLNEDMLAVARGLGPAIEWRQADAAALPLPDGGFDAVACQYALMFFSDAGAALAEMHRVLAPGGRAGLLVCRPIEHSPGYGALAGALARHLSPRAGEGIRSIFPAWDVAALRALLTGAGFGDVRIRIRIDTLRYPSPADFLRLEAASSPLAGPVAAMPAGDRDALVGELAQALADHTDDDGVVLALESFTVLARRW